MKISGSYASLLRGVSQQPPANRQPGQHTEQVNMIPDPVKGLVRRQGSINNTILLDPSISANGGVPALLAQATNYRKLVHTTGGVEYLIMLRTGTSAFSGAGTMPAVICYNTQARRFIPVNYIAGSGNADVETLIKASGISAAVSLGKYATYAIGGQSCFTAAAATPPANARATVWVRGGAYNRTYSIRISSGTTIDYTTPDPAAPGAAAAIAPRAIAIQLSSRLLAAGYTTTETYGSHIIFNPAGTISVTDGGDGTLLRGMYDEVSDAALLTLAAYNGTIINVKPPGTLGYYVKAVTNNGTAFSEVTWQETAGQIQGQILYGVGVMTVRGGELWVGMVHPFYPDGFSSALPNRIGDPPPVFQVSACGDAISNPIPRWMHSTITYMGIFQDRFIVASGAALSVSAAGDYYNFFRTTVLSVVANDAFEMVAQGSEDDYIRHSVFYNKNLVLFGDKRQYFVAGSVALTPTSANMSVMAAYPEAATVPPIAAGGLIYYARNRQGSVGVHQIQPGTYVDSAESFPTSPQIGEYIPADVAELEHVPGAPSMLVVRSRSSQRSLYVLHYLDQADGRKQEAWHRWDFGAALGAVVAVHNTKDGLLVISFRPGALTGALFRGYLAADLLPTVPGDDAPYLDSRKVYEGGSFDSLGTYNIAFSKATDRFLLGGALSSYAYWEAAYPVETAISSAMVSGIPFDSYVTLTAPYLRDNKGIAVVTGRQVVGSLKVSLDSSGDIKSAVTFNAANVEHLDKARIVGDALNIIGKQPVTSRTISVPVGRAIGEYDCTLKSVDWLPMCITNVSWVGQSFNRTPSA